MKGLLVRVGIDSSDEGHWNAPVDINSRRFAYIPIVETKPVRRGFERFYEETEPSLCKLGQKLPGRLVGRRMHLDPDFEFLTYGDQGRRARQIRELNPGDLLVFYAGLHDVGGRQSRLVYALIGLYVVRNVLPAKSVPKKHWSDNAHTRRVCGTSDIVVLAKHGVSGRLARCIPIGEYRNRAYRARKIVLEAWGGLSVKNGYLQRSARLPAFCDAKRFYRWFNLQGVELVRRNNL